MADDEEEVGEEENTNNLGVRTLIFMYLHRENVSLFCVQLVL